MGCRAAQCEGLGSSVIPGSAVFANSLIRALRAKPRTAVELCGTTASVQRRRWASYVQKRGLTGAKQQVHIDLQTLKRLGIIERVKLMGRCDLWRLAKTPEVTACDLLVVTEQSDGGRVFTFMVGTQPLAFQPRKVRVHGKGNL